MITHCILYLEAPNAKIKLFTDKEVTNWINNKLKDRKYHEVLTLTLKEFAEQKQNKKKRQEEVAKKQPKKDLNPRQVRKVCYTFIYSMHTACIQHADAYTNVVEFLSVDPYKRKLSHADYKHCTTLKMCMKQWQSNVKCMIVWNSRQQRHMLLKMETLL